MAKTKPSATKPPRSTDSHPNLPDGFDALHYYMEPSLDNFNLVAFRKYFRKTFPEGKVHTADISRVAMAPRDEERGAFYILLRWMVGRNTIDFKIEYHKGPRKHNPDESEPYAEDFMSWFGQFFSQASVHAHIHGYFSFQIAERESIVSVPMRLLDVDGAPDIDGLSFRWESAPRGVTKLRLTQVGSKWRAEAIAARRIKFATCSAPNGDANALAQVIDTVLRRRLK